ncbi:MAG: segregation/condensation protein A [bacterium]
MTQDVGYQIETEVFVGPFDLLLKAIDDGEIAIHQISLTQITNSYFEYWKREEPNLILASDFLYMAAWLFELKTKMLLPAREEIVDEQYLIDVEESLNSHIQEYQVYKNLAQTLRQRKDIFERVYGRHEGEPQERVYELVDISLKDLVVAFKDVYAEAAKRERVVDIKPEELTIDDRIAEVKKLLVGRKEGVPFRDIFMRWTRLEVVVSFLAVLELTKLRFISLAQSSRFGTIIIFATPALESDMQDAARTA